MFICFVSGPKTKILRQLIDDKCVVSGTNTVVWRVSFMCVWFSFSGDDSLGECSGDGDENDSCVMGGSSDEGDAGFSHAAFNYNLDWTGVDNPATPMAATSSRVGVDVQRHVGRTKVA